MSLAESIARHLGQGKEEGRGDKWVTCCPVHGDKSPSLSITDDAKNSNDVIVHCHTGCDYKTIKDTLRDMGLLPAWKPESKNGVKTTAHKSIDQPAPPPPPEKESLPWRKSSRDDLTHAVQYFAGRAITIDMPKCIRWGSYKPKDSHETSHMVVAAASRPGDDKVFAVQRLFIDLDAHKKTGAKMLGECLGRGVWFDRKSSLQEIIVAEGIENLFSCIQTTGKNGVAALSWSGVAGLIVPDEAKTLYIVVDSDPVRTPESKSMVGQKGSYSLAARFVGSREDRRAFFVTPDDTCFSENPAKLDFNDLLQADPGGESIRERFGKAINFMELGWTPPAEKPEDKEYISDEQAMFERFVFLASENKIIDTVGHDIKDSMMIERAFIVSQSGKIHEYIDAETGDVKKMPLTKHWLMSDKKKIASALQYHPGKSLLFTNGDGRNYFNTFRFPYQLADQLSPGEAAACLSNWNKIMDAVFHDHRGYIEDWLCFSIQQPEKRSGIMPICISEVGLGKSLVMSIVARVVGHQNFSNGKILDVTGLGPHGQQWGDWIYNKKVSCIEEISPEGETGLSYKILDALKDIITNETLPLNLKGGRNGTFHIFSNIIGFSNHNDCVKIPFDDRRLYIADSTGQQNLPVDVYGEIIEWMKVDKNIIAVYQYLLSRKIGKDFIPGRAKMTEAKQSLQAGGRSHMQQAFDIVAKQYPCDLLTLNELRLAVAQAMHHIDGGEGIVPAGTISDNDKQFRAIMQSMTAIVAGNKRIRIKRADGVKLNPSLIRVIRNKQDWIGATIEEIKTSMNVQIPYRWIRDDEEEVPF